MKVKMAERAKREKLRSYSAYFPLVSVDSVVELFRSQISGGVTPDLTLLSIVLGAVENFLTASDRGLLPAVGAADPSKEPSAFPEPIRFAEIEVLYQRFSTLVKGVLDLPPFRGTNKKTLRSSLELIKSVSNVIWAGLSSSYYKDRAHIQSLYSFLTGNKLDCFGVSLSVVAACQLLGLDDVHLALTEEHSWVVFGEDGSQSIEVTWHGRGVEDKRGQQVTPSTTDRSWLYLNGQCVVCDTYMEIAAMVTSINPSIATSVDSPELTAIQQNLLWMLYDRRSLKKYPMAITNIGDLEEINATPGRPSPELLFKEAIESAKNHYHNMHVYPYTYLGGYYYRMKCFKEALAAWAEASQVISKYNYHRDDEEVYKEFLEIANEIIPNAIRLSTEFLLLNRERSQREARQHSLTADGRSSLPLLQDPECCALFLKFYDGICEWEEGSSTPVLHITWATHMLNSLSKFDPDTREQVRILDSFEEATSSGDKDAEDSDAKDDQSKADRNGNCTKDHETLSGKRLQRKPGRPSKRAASLEISAAEDVKLNGRGSTDNKRCNDDNDKEQTTKPMPWKNINNKDGKDVGDEDQIKSTIKELMSKVGDSSHSLDPDPTIVALGHACGESILNPAYLLGKGEPFATRVEAGDSLENAVYSSVDEDVPIIDAKTKAKGAHGIGNDEKLEGLLSAGNGVGKLPGSTLCLRSTKMKEMKDLLTSKKLNASAIKLHLTAQSQVIIKHSRPGSELGYGYGKPVKRLRRL